MICTSEINTELTRIFADNMYGIISKSVSTEQLKLSSNKDKDDNNNMNN